MARKTFRITDMIDKVNKRNKEGKHAPELRHGWNSLLESMLHDAGCYSGFGYYTADQVPAGQKPGLIKGATLAENQFPDESRRFYYYPR